VRHHRGVPSPAVIMSTVGVNGPPVLERVYNVAHDFHALAVNYNFRWFLTKRLASLRASFATRIRSEVDRRMAAGFAES
jgi:hypothetical protein